jgi:SAM-dependent methyltransferase
MSYSLVKLWNHSTNLQKVCYILLIILILFVITRWLNIKNIEGFKDNSKNNFIIHKQNDIFDDFYVSVYDDLVYNYGKNNFEIGEITKIEPVSDNTKLLDVGSGTGHHVAAFTKKGIKASGVDISQSMVNKAKENYPDDEFIQGDVMDTMLFSPNSFSHITCLYFTIYYFEDKRLFFNNCMEWLMPNGFLILHLVDRDNFDPILPAGNPFMIISPQKYSDKRITNTVVKFDKFDYKCNFDLKEDIANLNETFKYKDGDIRQNEHKLYMETQKSILSMAKEAGFILHSKVDMVTCQQDSQYLYILQKPY